MNRKTLLIILTLLYLIKVDSLAVLVVSKENIGGALF